MKSQKITFNLVLYVQLQSQSMASDFSRLEKDASEARVKTLTLNWLLTFCSVQ